MAKFNRDASSGTEGKGDTSKQAAAGAGGRGSEGAPETNQNRAGGKGKITRAPAKATVSCLHTQLCD